MHGMGMPIAILYSNYTQYQKYLWTGRIPTGKSQGGLEETKVQQLMRMRGPHPRIVIVNSPCLQWRKSLWVKF